MARLNFDFGLTAGRPQTNNFSFCCPVHKKMCWSSECGAHTQSKDEEGESLLENELTNLIAILDKEVKHQRQRRDRFEIVWRATWFKLYGCYPSQQDYADNGL